MSTTSKQQRKQKKRQQAGDSLTPRLPKYRNDAARLFWVHPAERIHAWLNLMPQSRRDWYECMRLVWTHSENLYFHKSFWLSLLDLTHSDKHKWLMDKDEFAFLENLPDTFTVYRGCTLNKVNGMSWTLERKGALWFANRFNFASKQKPFDQDCCVVTGTVKKSDVFAYFDCRQESEIVVASSKVKNKTTKIIVPTK